MTIESVLGMLRPPVMSVETDTSYHGPQWAVLHFPRGARIVLTANPAGGYDGDDATASLDVNFVPADLQESVKAILFQVCHNVIGEPNDKKTWAACQKNAFQLLQDYQDKIDTFNPDGIGAYFEPTPEQVDRHELAGYVSILFRDYRIVLDFLGVPTGEAVVPGIPLSEVAVEVKERVV